MTPTENLLRRTLHHAVDGVEVAPPSVEALNARPHGVARGRARIVLVATAALLLLAGGAAASQIWDFDVRRISHPEGNRAGAIENSDLFAPGAPFHCTDLFSMAPSEAEQLVRDRGFAVSWQYDVPGWPIDKRPPETAYIDSVVMMDRNTARLIATPERRPVRPDGGCPQ